MKNDRSKFIIAMTGLLVWVIAGILTIRYIAGNVPAKSSPSEEDLANDNALLVLMTGLSLLSGGLCIYYLNSTRALREKGSADRIFRFLAWLFLLPLIGGLIIYGLLLVLLNG